jgi:hypothetical protein
MGAPQKYDRDLITATICSRLATGEMMTAICRDIGVPVKTVNDWRLQDAEIRAKFDEARDLGYDAIAEDCLFIADTPELGVIEKLERVPVGDGEGAGSFQMVVTERRQEDMLGHRKLRIDTRLKLLSKWDPRRYGDKMQLSNDPDNPLPAPQFIIQPVKAVDE